MEVVNDAQLMELVREPARELLPWARRASVVQSLVVLLAFMPGLVGFWGRAPNEATCQQGLLAFDVTSGERPIDWIVKASRGTLDRSEPGAPLATLLTAIGLEVELLSPESRLLLVSYLSSVLLLLSLGNLAHKIGGSRFALLTVCLACGHREFLALSESLPPVALPLALAVLSFRALLAHQTADTPLLSWPLIASGFALGACSLASAEVASASWCVLLVVSVLSVCSKKGSSGRGLLGRGIRHRLFDLMIVFASLMLLSVLAWGVFAGWHSAFSKEISLPKFGESASWFRRSVPAASQVSVMVHAVLQTTGAWLGFALLGVVQVVRGRMKFQDGAGTRGFWFLAGWSSVALIVGWVTLPAAEGDRANSSTWMGFFLLPMLLLAAAGLEAVLRREFSLGAVVMTTLLTISVVLAPDWMKRQPSLLFGSGVVVRVLAGMLVIGGGVYLIRRIAKSESLSRMTLLSCVALLVLVDVSFGILARPGLADDERELLAFRRQLVTENRPDECWLLTIEPPPARLRFLLRGLWHNVAWREANDWETVVAKSRQSAPTQPIELAKSMPNAAPLDASKGRVLVVTWGNVKAPTADMNRRSQSLIQSTTPHYLYGRPLKGFRRIDRGDRSNHR